MEKKTEKSPAKVFSCGPVKAAIWSGSRIVNDTLVEMHSIRIDKSYKDKETGQWNSTHTFNAEDLPKVATVATEAYRFLRMRSFEPNKETLAGREDVDIDP